MYICIMKKSEIQEFLKPLNKKDLKKVIKLAEEQLNSSFSVGDTVTLVIYYMIGDSSGDTQKECEVYLETQDDLDALNLITYILDNYTQPNEGHWGFSLDEESFSEKPEEVYSLLFDEENTPKIFNGVKITPKILETITDIVNGCFYGEAEYSFLTFQGYEIKQ